MQPIRFWATAFLAVVVAAGSPGCDHDEPSSRPSCANCGGAGGNPEGLGGAASAGEDSSASGSSTLPNGGAAAAANGGGAAGVDSQSGGSAGVGAGGEGGAVMGHSGEQLDICVRLAQAPLNATAVDMAYTRAVTLDCRVKWVVPRGQDLPVFQNQVLHFNYAFWGCPQWLPVETFGLVFGTPALSQGDVDLLIDHYLTAAQNTLDLSPLERETMQAALVRLSKPLIMDASLEPSQSRCLVNMGGAGGAAGAHAGGADTGGAAGAGGAAANSAGGAL